MHCKTSWRHTLSVLCVLYAITPVRTGATCGAVQDAYAPCCGTQPPPETACPSGCVDDINARVTVMVELEFEESLVSNQPLKQNVTLFFDAARDITHTMGPYNMTYVLSDTKVVEFYQYTRPQDHHLFIQGYLSTGIWTRDVNAHAGLDPSFDVASLSDAVAVNVFSPDPETARRWYEVDSVGVIVPEMTLAATLSFFGLPYKGVHQGL